MEDDICDHAAANGDILMHEWLHSQGCVGSTRTCSLAAANGHLYVLQFLVIAMDCPWDASTCS